MSAAETQDKPTQRRTVGQKWDQIQAARDLERRWTKRQILETYLNLSTFRGEVQGVAAAGRATRAAGPRRASRSCGMWMASTTERSAAAAALLPLPRRARGGLTGPRSRGCEVEY